MRELYFDRRSYQFGVGGCKAPELPLPFSLPGFSFPWVALGSLDGVKRCELKFLMHSVALA